MEKYSKEQISETRRNFRENNYPEVEVNLGRGIKFSYFVLPQSLEPRLPNFVFRSTGNRLEDGFVFGIADSVPEKFRVYAVAHEFIEFMKIGIDTNGRCVSALEKELEIVPLNIRRSYIEMRMNFFKDLIRYYRENRKEDESDVIEFERSLERLREYWDEGK